MSDLDNLLTRRTNILAELAALTSRPAYSIDGQSVDHSSYRKSLLEELRMINETIGAVQGPVEYDIHGLV